MAQVLATVGARVGRLGAIELEDVKTADHHEEEQARKGAPLKKALAD